VTEPSAETFGSTAALRENFKVDEVLIIFSTNAANSIDWFSLPVRFFCPQRTLAVK